MYNTMAIINLSSTITVGIVDTVAKRLTLPPAEDHCYMAIQPGPCLWHLASPAKFSYRTWVHVIKGDPEEALKILQDLNPGALFQLGEVR